jgi:hypothetical protein
LAIDFGWLITAFNNIATNINSFFSGIWSSVTQITNTGQGLFGGLVSFGGWIYQGLVDAYKQIQTGFTLMGDALSLGIQTFAADFYTAWNYLSQNLFDVGQWLWAGIQGSANMIANAVIYIQNAVWTFMVDSWNTLYANITSYKTMIDQWFADMVIAFRTKLVASIQFSVTTDIAWKSIQRIPEAKSMKDLAFGFLGAIIAPIPAYLMAHVIDTLVPTPTSTTYKVLPDFAGLTLISPTLNPYAPTPPTPTTPMALTVGVGVGFTGTGITISVFNGILAPTVSVSAVSEPIGEEALTIAPTVALTMETIP